MATTTLVKHQATVKAVLSGDTLQLVGKSVANASGPPPEMTITLASLVAPVLSRGTRMSNDEKFAWESREFLRKLCVGKSVSFSILYVITSINRTFGDVILVTDPGTGDGISLGKAIVSAGWASVKDAGRDASRNSADHAELVALEQAAKANKLGMFANPNTAISRNVTWAPTTAELEEVYNKACAGATPDATGIKVGTVKIIIEGVRDGATLRVLVLDSFTYVSFYMAGVICPRAGSVTSGARSGSAAVGESTGDGDADDETPTPAAGSNSAEPFGQQAKLFTELRLLNRELTARITGVDTRGGALIGTILHPKGDVAVELVRNGLGRLSERSIMSCSRETALALRQAEFEAKTNRRFLWQDDNSVSIGLGAGSAAVPPRIIEGPCIEVLSGDTIVILVEHDSNCQQSLEGTEVKVSLSSIRAPRFGNFAAGARKQNKDSDNTVTTGEPFGQESRDFLRSRCVGNTVRFIVDYEKYQQTGPATAGGVDVPAAERALSLRLYGTGKVVGPGGSLAPISLSSALVTEGLATCLKYRNKDEPRSCEYPQLVIAEAESAVKFKGLHSTLAPPTHKLVDLSNDGKKAKAFLSVLQPKRPYRAVVEFVYSGSRIKVRVPSESSLFQLSLCQVRCPLGARGASNGVPARAAEPFSEEAKLFTRRHLLQRDVEIVIDSVDKNGIALGRVYSVVYGAPGSGRSGRRGTAFVPALLRTGLARLDRYAEEGDGDGDTMTDLQGAQDAAKLEKAGVWSIPEPVGVEEDNDQDEIVETEKTAKSSIWTTGSIVNARLSEIVDGVTCYLNAQPKVGIDQLRSITDALTVLVPVLSALEPALEGESDKSQKGKLVALKFVEKSSTSSAADADAAGYWCRGTITSIDGEFAEVYYPDYGNSERRALSSLVSLDVRPVGTLSAENSALLQMCRTTPALAIQAKLAFFKLPPRSVDESLSFGGETAGSSAGYLLHDLAWNKDLIAVVLAVQRLSDRGFDREKSNGDGKKADKAVVNTPSFIVHVALYLPSAIQVAAPAFPPLGEEEAPAVSTSSDPERLTLANFSFSDSISINEKIGQSGFVLLSREHTRLVVGASVSSFSGGRSEVRGRPGMQGNFLLTSASSPSAISASCAAYTAAIYGRVHAALQSAYKTHVGIYRYGDPGDSDDDERKDQPANTGSGAGGASKGSKKGGK